eukprot:TRINITY_DN4635_c0_g2_i1.p1 TRINITY_DN4635_c0_g2~~TRINITY_DN4635_c0_g2_i1.p1  ORF type:complete len:456 (-),score=36.17 TRINITY_DN4635_c0_g2_i1:530-1852(-)
MPGGDTTLMYLLAGGLPDFAPLKVGLLLDAGADVFQKCPVYLWDIFGHTVGNALHIASMFSSKEVAEVLLKHINWDAIESINDLRMSCGFLPIHLSPYRFRTWLAIYRALKHRFPEADLLLDDSNTEGWIPIHAVVGSRETGNLQPEILALMEYIIRECPQALSQKGPTMSRQPSLTGSTIDCFCNFLLEDNTYSSRAFDLIQRVVAAQLPDLSRRPPCTLAALGFIGEADKPLGTWLYACCAYAPQIFDHVVAQHSSAARAICLHVLLSRPPMPRSSYGISKIISLGFDLELPEDVEPVLDAHPLWHYIAVHWVPDHDFLLPEDYLASIDELDRGKSKEFWQTLWPLIKAFEAAPPGPDDTNGASFNDFFPPPWELVVFSEPDDVIRFFQWGKQFFPNYVSSLQHCISEFYQGDQKREEEAKPNRFQAYADFAATLHDK